MKSKLFKNITRGIILGAFVLAFAGAANAASFLNTYGTGEEFNFWENSGAKILKSAPIGCTSATSFILTTDSNSGVVVGSGCPTAVSSDNGTTDGLIYFSFTNKASWDGIDAVNNFFDPANWGTYDSNGNLTAATQPCPNANERKVATCATGSGASCTGGVTYTCQPIHIGLSNLEANAIVQTTTGTLQGPIDGQDATGDSFTQRFFTDFNGNPGVDTSNIPTGIYPIAVNGVNYTSTNPYQNPSDPMIYPYGFYVNPGVMATRCVQGTVNAGQYCYSGGTNAAGQTGDQFCGGTLGTCASGTPNAGKACAANYNCGNYPVGASDCTGLGGASSVKAGDCAAQTIDNLSRLQVVALLSGKVSNWSDFGGYYVSRPVILCMRHSGAGTLSTLDLGVMNSANGTNWGGQLEFLESRVTNGKAPFVYFNDLAGDEKNCLTWANGGTVTNSNNGVADHPDTLPAADKGGAIGYLDADTPNTANYIQVKYNGVYPTRYSMRDGIYDNFYINDRLYAAAGLTNAQLTIYGGMLTYVLNPSNYTNANIGGTRGDYYGTVDELNFLKPTGYTYPNQYSPTTSPSPYPLLP